MLTIDNAASFADTVAGFQGGDTIDLANLADINALSYNQAAR